MMSNNYYPDSSLTEHWNMVLSIDSAPFYFFRGVEGLVHPKMGKWKAQFVSSTRSNFYMQIKFTITWIKPLDSYVLLLQSLLKLTF